MADVAGGARSGSSATDAVWVNPGGGSPVALGRRKYLELDLEGYLELGGSPMFSKDFGASSYCVLSLPSAARAPLLSIS